MDERLDAIGKKIDCLSKSVSQELESALHKNHEYQKRQQKREHRLLLCAMFLFGISAIAAIGGVVATIFF